MADSRWRASQDEDTDQTFAHADALRLYLGYAFVAQSAGSGMGAYSFLAGRSWLAVLVLIPTVFAFDAVRKKQGQPYGWPKEKSERKTLLAAGLVCGTFLFAASAAQQIGITINPSTAKARS